jgi:hypothetical protein
MKFRLLSTVLFIVVLMLVALVALPLQAEEDEDVEVLDHIHILTNFMEGETSTISLEMTLEDAEEEGYVSLGGCVPGMGIHAAIMGEQGPEQPILLFSADGDLIGIEFESLTEQPTPPWERLEEGHEGMELEHWTMHIYYTHEPELACETEDSE